MLSDSPDLHYVLDLTGSFLYINKSMEKLYHKPKHEIIGTANYNQAMPPAADVREYMEYIVQTHKECHGEIHIPQTPHAPSKFFKYVFAPVFNHLNQIIAIAGTARDITAQKEAEAHIWHNANYDYLTNLANRRRFNDKLDAAVKHTLRTNEGFALFFIDLDRFKAINDGYGHDNGDRVLKHIAARLLASLRNTDVVARVGGDEFTVIVQDYQQVEHVRTLAEKIVIQIKKPIRINHTFITIGASLGITLCPEQGCDIEVLLSHADKAMYTAKKNGGNQFVFYS